MKLTPQQAAARLGVSVRTLSRYVEAGLLTVDSRTPGNHRRFDADDVDALREPLPDDDRQTVTDTP